VYRHNRISTRARSPAGSSTFPICIACLIPHRFGMRGLKRAFWALLIAAARGRAFMLAMTAVAGARPRYGGMAHAGVLVSNTKASLVSGDRGLGVLSITVSTSAFRGNISSKRQVSICA
jgi:hypothetical protein